MLGSVPDRSDRVGESGDGRWGSERAECELCEEVRQCWERFDITTCEDCEAAFLPPRSVVY